jgi:hypothetical protein
MSSYRVLLIASICVLAVLVFTQVILPAWNSKPMFPMFRRKVAQREARVVEASDAADERLTNRSVERLGKIGKSR